MPFIQYCLLVRGIWHKLFLFHRLKTLNNKWINKQTNKREEQAGRIACRCFNAYTLVSDFVTSYLGGMATETRFLRHSMAQIRVVTFTHVLLKRKFWKDLAQPGWHTERIPMFSLASFPHHLFYIPMLYPHKQTTATEARSSISPYHFQKLVKLDVDNVSF